MAGTLGQAFPALALATTKQPPVPPYATVPKAPLTPTQRGAIAQYLEAYSKFQTGSVGPHDNKAYWLKQSDAILLQWYSLGVSAHKGGNDQGTLPGGANPGMPGIDVPVIGTIGQFLGALINPHTWVRVAEFGAGGILIAVGVNAVLKSNGTYQAAKSTAKKIGKV